MFSFLCTGCRRNGSTLHAIVGQHWEYWPAPLPRSNAMPSPGQVEPGPHPTITAWRLWTETSRPLLLNIEGNTGKLAEAAVKFSKELIDHGFHPGVAPQFAAYAGVTVQNADILPCLAAYRERKGLMPNFQLGMFTPYTATQTAPTAQTRSLLPPRTPTTHSPRTPPTRPRRPPDRAGDQRREPNRRRHRWPQSRRLPNASMSSPVCWQRPG